MQWVFYAVSFTVSQPSTLKWSLIFSCIVSSLAQILGQAGKDTKREQPVNVLLKWVFFFVFQSTRVTPVPQEYLCTVGRHKYRSTHLSPCSTKQVSQCLLSHRWFNGAFVPICKYWSKHWNSYCWALKKRSVYLLQGGSNKVCSTHCFVFCVCPGCLLYSCSWYTAVFVGNPGNSYSIVSSLYTPMFSLFVGSLGYSCGWCTTMFPLFVGNWLQLCLVQW